MGYVLPVTPYTYINYHQRTINQATSLYYIGQKPRVTFQEVKREKESETASLRTAYLKNKSSLKKSKPSLYDRIVANQIEQNKGKQINLHI